MEDGNRERARVMGTWSPMTQVHWLVLREDIFVGEHTFYHRLVDNPFLPRVGDLVAYLTSADEPGGSAHLGVRSVEFDFDGTPHVNLKYVVVDPEESLRSRIASDPRLLTEWDVWWSKWSGDLEERLRDSGWTIGTNWEQ